MSDIKNEYVVYVRTGDVQDAGTDANVTIILHDKSGTTTDRINLDNFFRDDFERGNLDVFKLPKKTTAGLKDLNKIEVFRDDSGWGSSWYVEHITVENKSTGDVHVFPVFRWLRPHYHYIFKEHDTCLPQDDDEPEQRNLDLQEKKRLYRVDQADPTFPATITELPVDEQFSAQYRWDVAKLKINLIVQSKIAVIKTGNWSSLDDLRNVYVREIFNEPQASKLWKEDWFFGYQRLNGLNPNLITLCTKIPEKLAVTEEELLPFLEGKSLEETLTGKRLFYCDLNILHKHPCKSEEFVVCAPILLLYANNKDKLVPISLQLFQDPGCQNPVFLPSDDKYTWLLAKMWYNHAEASYHQSVTHLGFTHLIMEGVCLALHRNVSVSHPIFKLLAPHLLYLLPINRMAVDKLLAPAGWIDKTMSVGREGLLEMVRKGFKEWKMDVHWNLPADLKLRGVYDKDVLPGYYYRDDALMLHDAILTYVRAYVDLYYESQSSLTEDGEIQAWAREMIKPRDEGGMGLQGVPGSGEFKVLGQLTQTLTSIIFTSSVQHAAVNFPQYDYYGFPPVFALSLRGNPPTDKKPRKEVDVLNNIPNKNMTFDSMIVTKILSRKGVKSLADFEVQYVFDPKARKVVETFREDLKKIGEKISEKNSIRDIPYEYLHPDSIPNSISI